MPTFSSLTEQWDSGTVVTASAPTNGVLPALFASQYYPDVYDDQSLVREGVESLPGVLSEAGYETAGFVASNPFAGKWSEQFGTFWNDGIEVTGNGISDSPRDRRARLKDILLLRERVPAADILSRAGEWWEETSSPRFLWVHLMEPHKPYKPGLALGREYGLLRAYATLAGFDKFPQKMIRNERARNHVKSLYYQSVKALDSVLAEWLSKFTDSATVIVTGDHGEEFNHGMFGHVRLYDEVVTVPIYTNADDLLPSPVVRQLDFGPSVLSYFDVPTPEGWEGRLWEPDIPPQLMITRSPKWEKAWVGVRTKRWKLIECYDLDTGLESTEAYCLDDDPAEERPLQVDDTPDEVRTTLDEFRSRPAIESELCLDTGIEFDESAKSRLKDLGYIN